MTKKLLLICALFVMCVGRISAQNEEPVWYLTTDSEEIVPLSTIVYMLFADEGDVFSIVKYDGGVVNNVHSVTFAKGPLASVEGVDADKVDLSIFPNPVASELKLNGLRENAGVKVLALDGATLIDTVLTPANNRVDVSGLAAGVYLLQVNETTVKFIKK